MYAGLSLSEPEAGHIVSSTHTWSHCLSQKLVTLSEPEAGQDFFDVLRKPRNELPLLRVEPVAMFLPSQLGKLFFRKLIPIWAPYVLWILSNIFFCFASCSIR